MQALVAAVLAMIAPQAPCRPDLAALTAPAQFARHAQPVTGARWKAPDVGRGEARLFRTVIRDQSRGAPNFAGHVTLVRIGCGAGAVCPAFVDRRTGRVTFVPTLRVVASLPMDMDTIGYETLTYRRDSRLLIVIGMPMEDTRRSGVSFYRWQGTGLRLTRFVPLADFCAGQGVAA